MRNISHENEFDWHENKPVGRIHFNLNAFATKTSLDTEAKSISKWPIENEDQVKIMNEFRSSLSCILHNVTKVCS